MLLKLIGSIEQFDNGEKVLTRVDYVEKREIDRSTLYSFDWPFQLINADVGNLEFLGKGATVPRYALLLIDLYSSKVYVYQISSENKFYKKWNDFMKI